MNSDSYFFADWPAPQQVKALCTTRLGGVSQTPFHSFNLALHVNDNPATVTENRTQLATYFQLPPIQFLNQVHGKKWVNLAFDKNFTADAAYTRAKRQPCAVLTADCLPLLVTDQSGSEIAAIHAGWRGLLAGVIDETIQAFQAPPPQLMVWLGPALGPCHFELNAEILQAFLTKNSDYHSAFRTETAGNTIISADFYKLAKINLQALGVNQIHGGGKCSYCDATHFYSHRRDQAQTGRMVSMIWIE